MISQRKACSQILRHAVYCLWSLFLFGLSCYSVTAETQVDLGGPRKATAKVSHEKNGKFCIVSFLPVKAFDKATNHLTNQAKSETYAIKAFAKDQKIPQGVNFLCKVRRVSALENRGEYVTCNYQLEFIKLTENSTYRDGLSESNNPKLHPPKNVNAGSDIAVKAYNQLLSAEEDMTSTLSIMVSSLRSQISELKQEKSPDSLDHNVAEIEVKIYESIDGFDLEVQSESMLLESEKKRLKATSHTQKKDLINELSAQYRKLANEIPN